MDMFPLDQSAASNVTATAASKLRRAHELSEPIESEHDETEPVLVYEERGSMYTRAVSIAMSLQRTVLREYPRRHPERQEVARRRTFMSGLRLARSTAIFFSPVIEQLARVCLHLNAHSAAWTILKPLSMEGYDVVQNRLVDYGNVQYRAVLLLWCILESRIAEAMQLASTAFAGLDINSADTPGVLNRQGDVIEIMLALCRGVSENFGLRQVVASTEAWRQAYVDLLSLCRAVDYLYSHACGKPLKHKPFDGPCLVWRIDAAGWPHDVRNSSFSLAIIALCLDV